MLCCRGKGNESCAFLAMEWRYARAWSGSVRLLRPGPQETNKRRGVSAMPVTPPAGGQQRFAPLTTVEQIPLPEYSVAATHHPGGRCLLGAQVSGKQFMPLPARYPQQHIQQCGIGPEPAEPLAQAIKADEAALLPKLQGLGKVSAGGRLVEQRQLPDQRQQQHGRAGPARQGEQ